VACGTSLAGQARDDVSFWPETDVGQLSAGGAATGPGQLQKKTDAPTQFQLQPRTGAETDGFAQQLANELGVPVYAPNKFIWTNMFGIDGIFGRTESKQQDYNNPGQYNAVFPQKK
jgi:hypothetical protein